MKLTRSITTIKKFKSSEILIKLQIAINQLYINGCYGIYVRWFESRAGLFLFLCIWWNLAHILSLPLLVSGILQGTCQSLSLGYPLESNIFFSEQDLDYIPCKKASIALICMKGIFLIYLKLAWSVFNLTRLVTLSTYSDGQGTLGYGNAAIYNKAFVKTNTLKWQDLNCPHKKSSMKVWSFSYCVHQSRFYFCSFIVLLSMHAYHWWYWDGFETCLVHVFLLLNASEISKYWMGLPPYIHQWLPPMEFFHSLLDSVCLLAWKMSTTGRSSSNNNDSWMVFSLFGL